MAKSSVRIAALSVPAAEPVAEPVAEPKANTGGITILNNIPIPAAVRGCGKAKYPWASVNVGESFFVPGITNLKSFQTACVKAGKVNDRKFIVRKYTLDGADGVMVWRTL